MGYNVEQEKEKNTLGNLLSAARKNKNLKQTDVCDRLKAYGTTISQSAYSAWEKGVSLPNPYQLTAICLVLDIKPMEDSSNGHGTM